MKKLFAVLASIFVAASAYGVTNSTLIDFAITGNADNLQAAGDDTNEVVSVQQNLYNDNWVVWLNESARLTENRRNSYVTNVDSKGNNGAWEAGKVLGVRVHFPLQAWNSYALVKPAYQLEMYGGADGTKYTEGKGVIHNVGEIKSISSWVYGRNYLVSYFVNLQNELGELKSYPMGTLYFSGWRQVKWENREYLANVRDRVLVRTPLYPRMIPSVKLDSLGFYRTKDTVGGDFIAYVKDVTMEYDVVVVDFEEDIDDEATWQLLKTENERKQAIENARIREAAELQQLEQRRINGGGDAQQQDAGAAQNTQTEETAAQ
ncbi:flagellar filament outer layer protein FlaA [uncultured Brachyspira sp.]|uniref:flagellar filament outer layer protein FlaA n=1 Tax=uncultured Brachyspira sp. TaxID=221953 RepID=UPI002622E775|nr:flagellar filament outer layer protein FlaA [uncultured Brachyspira sp.]